MFQKLFFLALSFISVFLLLSEQLYAQEEFPSDSLVSISLKDGTTLKRTIVKQDETTITVLTLGGLEVKVPLSLVISIQPLKGRVVKGKYRADPNYSRLMFAPTGRPLRQGDGYFSDLYVFLPSIAYGLTSNISVMAGFSIVPFIGFDSQLKYIAPRIGFQPSEKFAVSVGVLYTTVEEWTAGITFAVASFGQPDKSFTAGVGIGYTKKEGETFEFTKYPIIMLA